MTAAVLHYLPPREDGRPSGSSPAFTSDPAAVTCPTCRERLEHPQEA